MGLLIEIVEEKTHFVERKAVKVAQIFSVRKKNSTLERSDLFRFREGVVDTFKKILSSLFGRTSASKGKDDVFFGDLQSGPISGQKVLLFF